MGKFKAFIYLLLTVFFYVILAILGAFLIDYIVKAFTFNTLVILLVILAYLLFIDPLLVFFLMKLLPFKAKMAKDIDIQDYKYPDQDKK